MNDTYMDRIFEARKTIKDMQSNSPPIENEAPGEMEIINFIRVKKLSQKAIAKKLGMSYDMFRKKASGTQVSFTEQEIPLVEAAVESYLSDLQKELHEIVKKDIE